MSARVRCFLLLALLLPAGAPVVVDAALGPGTGAATAPSAVSTRSAPGDPGATVNVEPPPAQAGLVGRLRGWVAGFGPLGPVVYSLAYAVLVVAFVPGSALTIGAGLTFGLVQGAVVVWLGANLGAAISFLLSRTLLRRRVERWVAGSDRFRSLDRAVAREGWKIVALTRLSPVFPFTLLNYAFGLTGVRFWPYVLASAVAMIPGTVLYVYLGAAGAQVAEAASGAASWGRTGAQIVGLAATLAVTVKITRMARRALRETEEAVAAGS